MLNRLRAAIAHWIAPRVRQQHAAALKMLQDNSQLQLRAVSQIRDNFQRALQSSNDQLGALYADAYVYLPDNIRERWIAKLGVPELLGQPMTSEVIDSLEALFIEDDGVAMDEATRARIHKEISDLQQLSGAQANVAMVNDPFAARGNRQTQYYRPDAPDGLQPGEPREQ